jgi:hypothetical protein
MADRYWVLGTGTWDSTNTVNWSDTSGGAGGASVPTASDNVFFDANSNVLATAFTVTMATTPRVCNDFTASGLDGAMTLAGSSIGLTVSGSLTFQATNFNRTYNGITTFNATTTGKTITTNGSSLAGNVTFNGVGGGWSLGSALSTPTLTLTNGTFDLAGYTATLSTRFVTATGTKNLTFNGGTLICTFLGATAFNNAVPTGFTTTAGTGTGTISMTSISAKTFVGGGSTFNCTLNQGGAGALTITGSNTFSNITNTRKSVSATSILFTAGTTNTFTDWNASGESTRLLTIGSDTAASHTLSKASGTVSADFLSISRSTASGGAGWYAGANSTDGGNNSGWAFTAPPSPSSGYPYGSGHYGIGPYNIGNLIISGNASTGAVGTLLADRSIQEDGTIATGNVGTVDISRTVAITGNSSTLSVNSVLVSPILTGNSSTGAVGTLLPETISFVAITGVGGTGSVGSVTNAVSIAIIGVEASSSVGTIIGYGWSVVADTAESWSPVSDTSEDWTEISDNSETWTQVPA